MISMQARIRFSCSFTRSVMPTHMLLRKKTPLELGNNLQSTQFASDITRSFTISFERSGVLVVGNKSDNDIREVTFEGALAAFVCNQAVCRCADALLGKHSTGGSVCEGRKES